MRGTDCDPSIGLPKVDGTCGVWTGIIPITFIFDWSVEAVCLHSESAVSEYGFEVVDVVELEFPFWNWIDEHTTVIAERITG